MLQVIGVAGIIVLSRRIKDLPIATTPPRFDLLGAVLGAAGLFFIVLGVLQSGTYGWFKATKEFAIGGTVVIQKGGISPVWLFVAIGALIIGLFFWHALRAERAHRDPLLLPSLFRNRTSNLGLVTQLIQWLIMQGSFFVIAVFLQTIGKFNAIETGLILSPATAGILLASAFAGRMARNRTQRFLIRGGFVTWIAGMALVLLFGRTTESVVGLLPGLLIMGIGVGVMLTASANVVQSAFPDEQQGEISGLSRSMSNLGSSLGTAIVGSVLVEATSNASYVLALEVMVGFALVGLVAALLLPAAPAKRQPSDVAERATA
jgi:Na+/melibiose symporter-like transporter